MKKIFIPIVFALIFNVALADKGDNRKVQLFWNTLFIMVVDEYDPVFDADSVIIPNEHVAINKLIVDSFYRNIPCRPILNKETTDSAVPGCADVKNKGLQ